MPAQVPMSGNPMTGGAGKPRPKMRRQSSVKMATNHLKKHKVKHGLGCGAIVTIAVVLGVVLGAVGAAAYFYKQRNATAAEQAQNAQAESAAVNFGQISVVPPKEEKDASRRLAGAVQEEAMQQLSAALSNPEVRRALRGIDTESFDILSDYKTTTTSTAVDDGLSGALMVPNIILCMLSETRAEKFFNKGPYRANVHTQKCSSGPRNGPVTIDEWTLVATGPNATETKGTYEVSAWLKLQGQTILFKTETPKEKISFRKGKEFGTEVPEVGEFTIKFTTEKDSEGNNLKGYIMFATDGDDRTLKYTMEQANQPDQSVFVTYNKQSEAGWARVRAPQYSSSLITTVVSDVGWSADFLKQSGNVCLDRANYVGVGQDYVLFDTKGARVDIETHFTVAVTVGEDDSTTLKQTGKVIKADTTFVAGVDTHNIYVYGTYDDSTGETLYTDDEEKWIKERYFSAGKKVHEHSWNDAETDAQRTEYTIHAISGKMEVRKEDILPIQRFEGAMLTAWTVKQCGANSTAGATNWGRGTLRLEVKNGKMYKTAQTADSFQSCECEGGSCGTGPAGARDAYEQTIWTKYPSDIEVTGNQIHFYSDVIRGSGVYNPSKPDSIKVESSAQLRPTKEGEEEKRLLCFSNCLDGSKIDTADPYFATPNSYDKRRDTAKVYTYNAKTGVLQDPNGNPVTKAGEGQPERLNMNLFESNQATFAAFGCPGDDETIACPNAEWEVFPRYNWQTGRYSGFNYLKDSAGNSRMPVDSLRLKVAMPDKNLRSLSGLSYTGKSFQIEYQNGYISGLPAVCQDSQTFEYRTPNYALSGGVMYARCPDSNTQVADVLIPAGTVATETDLFTGTSTEYVLKPTRVLQKLKASEKGMSSCADVMLAPEGTEFPGLDLFGEMNMAKRPEAGTLKVKVEAGELVADTKKE